MAHPDTPANAATPVAAATVSFAVGAPCTLKTLADAVDRAEPCPSTTSSSSSSAISTTSRSPPAAASESRGATRLAPAALAPASRSCGPPPRSHANARALGGAVASFGCDLDLRGHLRANRARLNGGAAFQRGGMLRLDAFVDGNVVESAYGYGGAVSVHGGETTLYRTYVLDNGAPDGAALAAAGGTVTVEPWSFSG